MRKISILRTLSVAFAGLVASSLMATSASAGSSTGTIGVSLNVAAACAVNGGSTTAGALGQIGTLSFPDQSGVFGNVDAAVVPSAGAGGVSVLCSPGLQPSLTVGSGANDSGGVRRLKSGANNVAYRLYTDAGRSQEISIGQQISLGTATTTAFDVPIYGRVNSGGLALPAGSYVDTVQVTLSW